ncbi:hypothetical protein [Galbibacter sp. PAP.153]|uniref:hypothetical protein n=1 Tax=Galbibacter sp. PAP.153 TaxID=3104623 RepID=UPI00300A41FF
MSEAIWGFIGVILGTTATIVITFLNNKHEVKLLNKEEYNIKKDKFKEFQINNFIEMQELIDEFMRCISKIYMYDLMVYKKKGQWGKEGLDENTSSNEVELKRKILIKTQRISSQFVRSQIEDFIFQYTMYTKETDFERASKLFKILESQSVHIIKELGKNLRDLYIKI